MHITHEGRFERTDAWREGKWVDLWSVVHCLSGMSVGLGISILHFGAAASILIALLLFIAYEMWEMVVQIKEMPTNRFMDVVVGMFGFLPAFFLIAPRLETTQFILAFGLMLTANVVMSVFGWIASQKAAALKVRTRARYARERAKLRERAALVRAKFKRSRPH